MRYAIVTGTTIVDATDNEYGAIEYATKTNPGATYLPFATQDEILADPQYGIGQYIIANVRTSTLLEKTKIINPGRIYNTESFVVNVIDSWTIMNVADDVQKAHGSDIRTLTPDDIAKMQTLVKIALPASSDTKVSDKATDKVSEVKAPAPDASKAKVITTKITVSEPVKEPKVEQPVAKPAPVSNTPVTNTPVSNTPVSNTPTVVPVNKPPVSDPKPTPAPVSTPAVSVLPGVIKITSPPTITLVNPPVSVPQKQVLPTLPLTNISTFPLVLSIGNVNKNHRDKIEMLIFNNFAVGSLKEENIVVVTNGDTKIAEAWTKKFPTCFIYDRLDTDILYHLNPEAKFNKDAISKLVIFDQCLTGEFIQKKQFKTLLDNCRKNNIAMIVMTKDADVICSTVASKLEYTLLHTFTVDWTERVSAPFLSQHPSVASQKDLENHIVACARLNNCLAFCHNTPYTLSQF